MSMLIPVYRHVRDDSIPSHPPSTTCMTLRGMAMDESASLLVGILHRWLTSLSFFVAGWNDAVVCLLRNPHGAHATVDLPHISPHMTRTHGSPWPELAHPGCPHPQITPERATCAHAHDAQSFHCPLAHSMQCQACLTQLLHLSLSAAAHAKPHLRSRCGCSHIISGGGSADEENNRWFPI